jgi:hypothetical protein
MDSRNRSASWFASRCRPDVEVEFLPVPLRAGEEHSLALHAGAEIYCVSFARQSVLRKDQARKTEVKSYGDAAGRYIPRMGDKRGGLGLWRRKPNG